MCTKRCHRPMNERPASVNLCGSSAASLSSGDIVAQSLKAMEVLCKRERNAGTAT